MLNKLHATILADLQNSQKSQIEQLAEKQKQLSILNAKIISLGNHRYNIHKKKTCIVEQLKLQQQIEDIQSGKLIHNLCHKTKKFLHSRTLSYNTKNKNGKAPRLNPLCIPNFTSLPNKKALAAGTTSTVTTFTSVTPQLYDTDKIEDKDEITTISMIDTLSESSISDNYSQLSSSSAQKKLLSSKGSRSNSKKKIAGKIKKSVYSGRINPTAILSVETGGETAKTRHNRDMMLDEYSQCASKCSRSVYILPHLKCSKCGIHMHKLIDASVMVCPECGLSSKYLDSSSKSLGYNDEIEYVTFSYKRQNHFQEWLNAIQGRENTVIPQTVIETVMSSLYDSGIKNPDNVTRDHIREILKQKKLRRYYDNITSIICHITGRQPIRLKPNKEEQLKLMFMSIQRPFNKHRPPTRRNFLSYSYVLFKFCELLGLDHVLHCFRLLKGREKLYKQDQIFKKICEDLKWEFIPSI